MKIDPKDLLACVERMTDKQRIHLCELLDPAHPGDEDTETEIEEVMTRVERVMGLDRERLMEQGVQGPPLEAGEHDEYLRGGVPVSKRRVSTPVPVCKPVLQGLFRSPSPETVAQLIYGQLTGKKLEPVQVLEDGMDVRPISAADIMPAADSVAIAARDAEYRERWTKVQKRWQELFDEADIPMIRNPGETGADLDLIEVLLYEKEHKGLDPKRCPCGCTYVFGCGNFSDVRPR